MSSGGISPQQHSWRPGRQGPRVRHGVQPTTSASTGQARQTAFSHGFLQIGALPRVAAQQPGRGTVDIAECVIL